jgi:hypothetical protein
MLIASSSILQSTLLGILIRSPPYLLPPLFLSVLFLSQCYAALHPWSFEVEGKGEGEGGPLRPFATGNWGCGAFQGDPQIKSIQQWVVASLCGREMVYFPFSDARVAALPTVIGALLAAPPIAKTASVFSAVTAASSSATTAGEISTVGQVVRWMLEFDPKKNECFFDFLLRKKRNK